MSVQLPTRPGSVLELDAPPQPPSMLSAPAAPSSNQGLKDEPVHQVTIDPNVSVGTMETKAAMTDILNRIKKIVPPRNVRFREYLFVCDINAAKEKVAELSMEVAKQLRGKEMHNFHDRIRSGKKPHLTVIRKVLAHVNEGRVVSRSKGSTSTHPKTVIYLLPGQKDESTLAAEAAEKARAEKKPVKRSIDRANGGKEEEKESLKKHKAAINSLLGLGRNGEVAAVGPPPEIAPGVILPDPTPLPPAPRSSPPVASVVP